MSLRRDPAALSVSCSSHQTFTTKKHTHKNSTNVTLLKDCTNANVFCSTSGKKGLFSTSFIHIWFCARIFYFYFYGRHILMVIGRTKFKSFRLLFCSNLNVLITRSSTELQHLRVLIEFSINIAYLTIDCKTNR